MMYSHFDLNQQQPLFLEFFYAILLNKYIILLMSGPTFHTKCKHYASQNHPADFNLASCSMIKNPASTFHDISSSFLRCPPFYQAVGVLNLIFCPFTAYSTLVSSLQHLVFQELGTEGSQSFLKMSSSKMGFTLCLSYSWAITAPAGQHAKSASSWAQLAHTPETRPFSIPNTSKDIFKNKTEKTPSKQNRKYLFII